MKEVAVWILGGQGSANVPYQPTSSPDF